MAKSIITADRLRQLVRYEPSTGEFFWVAQRGPSRPGSKAGTVTSQGYRQLALDLTSQRACRMAFLYMTGSLPAGAVDHINGDRGDDRWLNLRDVTASVNMQNMRRAQRRNQSGLLGVVYLPKKGRWSARIRVGGRDHFIGNGFRSPEDAHAAYLAKKREIHPGCTL